MKKYWNLYIDDFLLEKKVNQWISDRMVQIYCLIFNLFIQSEFINPTDLTTYTPQNFKKFLWKHFIERNWSSSNYNHYRKYLRCYCEYLKSEWYLIENPFDKILKRKVAKQLPKTLTKNETKELLGKLPKIFNLSTFVWKRNETIVYTYLYTGLRLSELTNLKLRDLQIHEWYIKVFSWKWNKDRVIPLTHQLLKRLSKYLLLRNKSFSDSSDSPLFPTAYWKTLQHRDMKKIMQKIRAWISFYFTWHQLRHTFATELVRNNFDIFNISKILGHSSTETTKIYLSVDMWKLKSQLDNITLFA
jgi:site-specific recombinase XerD